MIRDNITLPHQFDYEFDLPALLARIDCPRLLQTLSTLLGENTGIVGVGGDLLWGVVSPSADRYPLKTELEPVGFLVAQGDPAVAHATVTLLELLLKSTLRYEMVARLHLKATQSDYEKLQAEHAALMESERRYKALTVELEERVAQQVQTIDNARRQLYQAEKMASVGQLAAGMAHEINNPIGFITSNLNAASKYLECFQSFRERLRQESHAGLNQAWREADLDFVLDDLAALYRESQDGAQRIARIVADLKNFSQVDHQRWEPHDVNDIIQSVCNVATPQLKNRVELHLDLHPLPLLLCDAGQLGQVFLSMLLNSLHAMPDGGEIRIATLAKSNDITIEIADNGQGIPDAVKSRIFDPFFTTKDVGQGTGLGLTVCHDVVKAHNGRIEVESELGVGATFIIVLPLK